MLLALTFRHKSKICLSVIQKTDDSPLQKKKSNKLSGSTESKYISKFFLPNNHDATVKI